MRVAGFCSAFTVLASISAVQAAQIDLSPTFRNQAAQVCTGDALRLCAAYVMDEDQMARCMEGNRRQLTSACRVVVEQGVRTYKR